VTLTNPNGSAITLSSAFVVLLPVSPGSLVIAAIPNANTNCGTATVTAVAGAGSLTLNAAGASIPASGSCTVSVNVTTATTGVYTGAIPAGALSTSAGVNQSPSSAYLTVNSATPPTATGFSQSFTQNGSTQYTVTTLIASALSPATIATYNVASLPNATVGSLYCNGAAITLASLPYACANNQLTFLPSAIGTTSWTFTATDSGPGNCEFHRRLAAVCDDFQLGSGERVGQRHNHRELYPRQHGFNRDGYHADDQGSASRGGCRYCCDARHWGCGG
jgi:hypothetical protein